jgi:hypothetical protein
MDNVQNCDSYINIPSPQTCKSYLEIRLISEDNLDYVWIVYDRLCGRVVKSSCYRSEGPGSIPGTTRKKNIVGLERGALSLVSTN